MQVLYKGKGCVGDLNNYRSITFLSHPFELLTKILSNRIYGQIKFESKQDEQIGFIRERSISQDIQFLRVDMSSKVKMGCKGFSLYALVVDFRIVFDLTSRKKSDVQFLSHAWDKR